MIRIIEFQDGSHMEFKLIQSWGRGADMGRNICVKNGCKHCNGDLYIVPNASQFCSTSPIFTSDIPARIIQETP